MADKKPKKKVHVTPQGTAAFCYISKPDTKFKEAGEYKTNLILSAGDAAPLIELADNLMAKLKEDEDGTLAELEEKRVAHNKKNKAQPKKQIEELQENLPYTPELDDDGEETGNIVFKFSTAASGKSKKTGKPWTKKLDVFDAKKKPIKGDVWSGSTIKVAFTESAWVGTPQSGYGVKFYLEAVQVLELVQGGNRNADGYGFGEEEGYEASDEPADDGAAAPGDTGDDDDGKTDF